MIIDILKSFGDSYYSYYHPMSSKITSRWLKLSCFFLEFDKEFYSKAIKDDFSWSDRMLRICSAKFTVQSMQAYRFEFDTPATINIICLVYVWLGLTIKHAYLVDKQCTHERFCQAPYCMGQKFHLDIWGSCHWQTLWYPNRSLL